MLSNKSAARAWDTRDQGLRPEHEQGYLSFLTRLEQDFDDVSVNLFSEIGAS